MRKSPLERNLNWKYLISFQEERHESIILSWSHWYLDNALGFGFTSPTCLYFFVALDIYISKLQIACFKLWLKRSCWQNTVRFSLAYFNLQWLDKPFKGTVLNRIFHCTVLYCTVLYYTVLYCTILYCTVLYCTVLYFTVLYCTVLYCTVLYCTVLYCTVM